MSSIRTHFADSGREDKGAASINSDELSRLAQFSLDQAVDAVFWIDSDGKFVYVNQAHALPWSIRRMSFGR